MCEEKETNPDTMETTHLTQTHTHTHTLNNSVKSLTAPSFVFIIRHLRINILVQPLRSVQPIKLTTKQIE